MELLVRAVEGPAAAMTRIRRTHMNADMPGSLHHGDGGSVWDASGRPAAVPDLRAAELNESLGKYNAGTIR
jgi:hypothetical protein